MIPKKWIKESSSFSIRGHDVQIPCTDVSLGPPLLNVIASLKNHVATQTSDCDPSVIPRPSRQEKGCQTVKSQVSVSVQTLVQISTKFDIKGTPRHIDCKDKKEDTVSKPQMVQEGQVSLPHSNVQNVKVSDPVHPLPSKNVKDIRSLSQTTSQPNCNKDIQNNKTPTSSPGPSLPHFLRSAMDVCVSNIRGIPKVQEHQPKGFSSFPHWK